jgi:hypothetical protein
MEMKGVVFDWKVAEMKLLGVQGVGMFDFENLDIGMAMDIPPPGGEKGEEIEKDA